MNRHQRQRLEALAGASLPCMGCLEEDLSDAQDCADGVVARLSESWRRAVNEWRVQQGQEPLEEASQQRQQRLQEEHSVRQAGQAEVDRITAVITAVNQTVPVKSRRTTCPSCAPRRRAREECEALAQRLTRSAATHKALEADRQAWIRERQSSTANGMTDAPATDVEDSESNLSGGGESSC